MLAPQPPPARASANR